MRERETVSIRKQAGGRLGKLEWRRIRAIWRKFT